MYTAKPPFRAGAKSLLICLHNPACCVRPPQAILVDSRRRVPPRRSWAIVGGLAGSGGRDRAARTEYNTNCRNPLLSFLPLID